VRGEGIEAHQGLRFPEEGRQPPDREPPGKVHGAFDPGGDPPEKGGFGAAPREDDLAAGDGQSPRQFPPLRGPPLLRGVPRPGVQHDEAPGCEPVQLHQPGHGVVLLRAAPDAGRRGAFARRDPGRFQHLLRVPRLVGSIPPFRRRVEQGAEPVGPVPGDEPATAEEREEQVVVEMGAQQEAQVVPFAAHRPDRRKEGGGVAQDPCGKRPFAP